MYQYGILLGLFSLLVSCGLKQPGSKKSKVYGEKSLGVPVSLMISQKECSDSEEALIYPTELMVAGKKIPYQADFSDPLDIISAAEFAGEYHGNSQFMLLHFPDVEREAIAFEPCKTEKRYEANSYQDATMSILSPIKKFEESYPELITYLDLDPVKIRTAPLLKDGNSYLINNAFYYSGTKEITFLPQGYMDEEDTTLPFGGVPFWKFPMVALHEYGHHIFSQIYKSHALTEPEELPPSSDSIKLCYDNSSESNLKSVLSSNSAETGNSRLVSKVMAITAINEGFADIFAYYADEKSRKLIGMGCLAKSRDVESSIFYNNEAKKISVEALDQFLSDEHQEYSSCSEDTNFQDPHIIGAVMARAIYRSLAYKGLDDKRKLSILLEWVESFTEKSYNYETAHDVLKLAVHEFHSALKRNIVLGKIDCIKYYSHFLGIDKNRCYSH